MRVVRIISSLVVAGAMTSCSGLFGTAGILAPRSIAGYQMDASGLEGSYHYKFFENNTYQRLKIFPSGKESPIEKGTWNWETSSLDQAVLTLDESLEVKLQFTTHEHANATIPDSTRLFPVEFIKPSE